MVFMEDGIEEEMFNEVLIIELCGQFINLSTFGYAIIFDVAEFAVEEKKVIEE